jgi:endo-alpha-1,4-polygalactosaminidase (GH114 family)
LRGVLIDIVDTLSSLEKREKFRAFAATATYDQKKLHNKIIRRKQAKAKAAEDEAVLLATRAEATKEDDLDALMAKLEFEEGDGCNGQKGEKKKSGGSSKKKGR